jgi:hypothetical protein
MQSRERQFHLGLDASSSHDAAARGTGEEVVEEGRLAYTGFAAKHDHAAGPGSRIPDEPIEQCTFGTPVLQS